MQNRKILYGRENEEQSCNRRDPNKCPQKEKMSG